MRVAVSSIGRFHTFDLAWELERRGELSQLFTAYPKSRVDRISPRHTKSFPWLMVPAMLLGKLGLEKLQNSLNVPMLISFDRWMAANLEPTDVFHSLSGSGTITHALAKQRYAALTVCDRGSTHLLYQKKILDEEYAHWGLPNRISDIGYDRELSEYETCDLIVVPSRFVRRTFLDYQIPEEKIAVVPYGVDVDLFRPLQKDDATFRVIFVGAMSFRKGLPYLMEAIVGLDLPNFEVWLIGSRMKETEPLLRKYSDKFRYLGFLPRAELSRYYSQGSVFVLPSIEEGLALVQAQAMACGLPLIVTPNTGAEELIVDGREGFIIPSRSTEAIKEKIIYLYEHPDVCHEMSRAALHRVSELNGWDTYGQNMIDLYTRWLAKRN